VADRIFQFRLRSDHPAPDRQTEALALEFLNAEGQWEPQDPTLTTPGFRLFLLSLVLCQHFYLVANAREMALPLHRVEGDIKVTTGEDWILTAFQGDFRISLDPAASPDDRAKADAAALDHIRQRMALCPVSRNLPGTVQKLTSLCLSEGRVPA
jgi:hypothetical protein